MIECLAACVTTPAVSSGFKVDPNTRPSCAAICEGMGLHLGALVLVRKLSGCVCVMPEPSFGIAPRAALQSGATAVASGALIVDEQQEQVVQQQQQSQPPTAPVPFLQGQ